MLPRLALTSVSLASPALRKVLSAYRLSHSPMAWLSITYAVTYSTDLSSAVRISQAWSGLLE